MSVNNMAIEDTYQFLKLVHDQVTGQSALAPTDESSFISLANTTLAAGTEPVLNTISQVVGRTVYAVRAYNAKFKGIELTPMQFGGIMRKISYADTDPVQDGAFHNLNDGTSVDPWIIKKPVVLETRYYGENSLTDVFTVFRDQLFQAFRSAADLSDFVSKLVEHYNNKFEQWREDMARQVLVGAIAAKNEADPTNVIHLITEYNTETAQGTPLTYADIVADKTFWRWVRARVNTIGRRMTARSNLYQMNISGYAINRHTPVADQKIYMLSDYLDKVNTIVNADTYHDEPLKYADVEGVDFWQSIQSPDQISATAAYIDSTGAVVQGTAQTMSKVFGIMFDRDALGYSVEKWDLIPSPLNPGSLSYDMWFHALMKLYLDLTEKIVVLCLD